MKIATLPQAETELEQAFSYYEQQKPVLGKRFVREIYATIGRIKQYPFAWQSLGSSVRRCQAKRFPYAVIYQIRSNEILIVAIAHLHRQPDYWQHRV